MSRLEIILICVSCVSIGLNVLFFAYARSAITRLLTVSEELGDLQEMINRFSEHVRSVYSLDMFYGDETLKYLMDHATSLNEQLQQNFEYIYTLTEAEEEIEDTAEEEDFDQEEKSP
jgi:sensor histidine kinase YesM